MNNPSHVEFGVFDSQILSEKIAARLLTMIEEKQLRPGDRLPPERELSLSMHVSRPSLREALRALSIMGIIQHKQGSGTYIAALVPSRLLEHLDFILSLDDSTFIDLFETRLIVEVGLAGMAAQKITAEEIDQLKSCLVRAETAINDIEAFLACDLEIHERIAEAARNKILTIFFKSVNNLNIYSRKRTTEIPDVRQHALTDHRKIVDAVSSHDVEGAREAMKQHINYVEGRYKNNVLPGEQTT